MPSRKTTAVAEAPAAKRGRGRPPRDANPEISRERIALLAIELSKTVPLAELTMVRLAKELGVTHTLLHYYMAGRDEIASIVVNHLFAQLFHGIGSIAGDWRKQLEGMARELRRLLVAHAGVTIHIATRSRHRLLDASAAPEDDFGLRFNDRLFQIMRSVGFTRRDGAMAAHLLANFALHSALGEVTRALPSFHADWLDSHLKKLDGERFPGMLWIAPALPSVSPDAAFETGLRYLLDGFAGTLERSQASARKRRAA